MSKSFSTKSKGPHLADSFDDSPMYSWEFLINDSILPSQVTNKNPHIQAPEKKLVEGMFWNTLDDLRASFRPSKMAYYQNKKRKWRADAMEWIYSSRTDPNDPRYTFLETCQYLGIDNPDSARLGLEKLCLQWSHSHGDYPILWDSPTHSKGNDALMQMNSRVRGNKELANRNDRERKRKVRTNGYRIEKAVSCCITI